MAQEHMMYITAEGTANTISIDVEMMQHLEGELDTSHMYMESKTCPLTAKYHSALQLLRQYSSQSLFATPELIRDQYILATLAGAELTGVWDETLVPLAKDIARWGVDMLPTGFTGDIVDVIGDIASLALIELAP